MGFKDREPVILEVKTCKERTIWNRTWFDRWRGRGPKALIQCWCCSIPFKTRLPFIDNPGVQCPEWFCGNINIVPFLTNSR